MRWVDLLCRGFNDAINGFPDDGWSLLGSEGAEDVIISVNPSPSKLMGANITSPAVLSSFPGGILCAKASMLLHVGFSIPTRGILGFLPL